LEQFWIPAEPGIVELVSFIFRQPTLNFVLVETTLSVHNCPKYAIQPLDTLWSLSHCDPPALERLPDALREWKIPVKQLVGER
jgi:hypothetical protein